MQSIYTACRNKPRLALLVALFGSFIICLPRFTEIAKTSYALLILIASAYLIGNLKLIRQTSRAERFFFAVLLTNFCWMAFSFYYNGEPGIGDSYLWGRHFYYLFLIPLFFLFREIKIPTSVLLHCLVASATVSALYFAFDAVNGIEYRLSGINMNKFGPIQLCVCSLLACFLPCVKGPRNRSALWIGIILAFATVLLSESKTTWLAATVICAFFILYLPGKWSLMRRVCVLLLALGLLASSYLLPVVSYRVDALVKNIDAYLESDNYLDPQRMGTFGTRMDLWKGGWKMFLEQPLTGSGVGAFIVKIEQNGEAYNIQRGMHKFKYVHSQYLTALIHGGIPGLILLLLVLCSPVYIGMKQKSDDCDANAARLALICIGITYLVVNLPDDHFEGKSPTMFLSVVLALLLARVSTGRSVSDSAREPATE